MPAVADRPDDAPAEPTRGEILPAVIRPDANAARALVGRLVRASDLPPDLLALVEGPLADAVSKAADYAGKSITPGTVETYIGRLDGVCPLGAAERRRSGGAARPPSRGRGLAGEPGTIARPQRAAAAGRGNRLAPSQPRLCLAEWSWRHRANLGRHPRPVRPAAALISADVRWLTAVCPTNLPGLRDRALFLVGLAGAFRRSELVGIDVAHLRFEADDVIVRIPRSKTDQGRGRKSPCRAYAGRKPVRSPCSRRGCGARRSGAGRCSAASPPPARSRAG